MLEEQSSPLGTELSFFYAKSFPLLSLWDQLRGTYEKRNLDGSTPEFAIRGQQITFFTAVN